MRIGVVNARRLSDEDRTELGTLAEELAEGEDAAVERIKGKLTRFDEVVGAPDRVEEIADDVVPHFEKRREAMAGGSRPPGLSPYTIDARDRLHQAMSARWLGVLSKKHVVKEHRSPVRRGGVGR